MLSLKAPLIRLEHVNQAKADPWFSSLPLPHYWSDACQPLADSDDYETNLRRVTPKNSFETFETAETRRSQSLCKQMKANRGT
jgi:hypothetical protein